MKRFRWGDVAPHRSASRAEPEDGVPEPDGLHARAVHGITPVDPRDLDPVHLRLTAAE